MFPGDSKHDFGTHGSGESMHHRPPWLGRKFRAQLMNVCANADVLSVRLNGASARGCALKSGAAPGTSRG